MLQEKLNKLAKAVEELLKCTSGEERSAVDMARLVGAALGAVERAAAAPAIWAMSSDLDDRLLALFISTHGDEETARARAWEIYTSLDAVKAGPFQLFHADARGLNVVEIGDCFAVGPEGLKISFKDPPRCVAVDAQLTFCVLPLGHSQAVQHLFAPGVMSEELEKRAVSR